MISRVVVVNGHSDENAYLRLTGVLDLFDASYVGGSSWETAGRQLQLDCGLSDPIFTDVDGTKDFFRARGWVRPFLKLYGLRPGDEVVIEKLAEDLFRLRPNRS